MVKCANWSWCVHQRHPNLLHRQMRLKPKRLLEPVCRQRGLEEPFRHTLDLGERKPRRLRLTQYLDPDRNKQRLIPSLFRERIQI